MAVNDDPVIRIVEAAMEAQTRLLLAYMEQHTRQLREELTKKLRSEFSGEQVYMGKGTAGRLIERDAAILADSQTMSLRALARKYHLSKSQVSRVLMKDGTVQERMAK
jgi:Mor family transcriptional regulator